MMDGVIPSVGPAAIGPGNAALLRGRASRPSIAATSPASSSGTRTSPMSGRGTSGPDSSTKSWSVTSKAPSTVPAGAVVEIAIRCGAVESTRMLGPGPRGHPGEVVVAEPELRPDLLGVEEPAVLLRGRLAHRQRYASIASRPGNDSTSSNAMSRSPPSAQRPPMAWRMRPRPAHRRQRSVAIEWGVHGGHSDGEGGDAECRDGQAGSTDGVHDSHRKVLRPARPDLARSTAARCRGRTLRDPRRRG